jgi:hypothetical protein
MEFDITLDRRDADLDTARDDHDADAARLKEERDAAIARAEKAEAFVRDYQDDHRAVVAGECADDERHCSCVPHLRREIDQLQRARDEVGIQLAAAQERLRLAMAVVEAARWVRNYYRDGLGMPGPMGHLGQALAALDAVPGDALAAELTDEQVDAATEQFRERSTDPIVDGLLKEMAQRFAPVGRRRLKRQPAPEVEALFDESKDGE